MTLYEVDGPAVLVPARVALFLSRVLELEKVQAKFQSTDAELSDCLTVWLRVATEYSLADCGRVVVPGAAMGGSSRPEGMTTAQIAYEFGLKARTVRAAAERGELHGELISGRWWFPIDEVQAWFQARPDH